MRRYVVGVALIFLGCAAPSQPTVTPLEARAAVAPNSSAPSTGAAPPPATSATSATGPKSDPGLCQGSIDEFLLHQLASRAALVRSCYENLLRREPQREGRLVVTVKLSEAGAIERAWVTLDELADPETTECALGFFKDPLGGTVVGNCAIVNVPLRFKIKKPDLAPPGERSGANKG